MQKLYILYDSHCELCRRCRVWLGQQPSYVKLIFLPFQAPEAECRFPTLRELHPDKEIVVVNEAGDVWQGEAAWVICLWALREYREWSQRLASPLLLPLARRLCETISTHRYQISRWLNGGATDEQLRFQLEALPPPVCEARR